MVRWSYDCIVHALNNFTEGIAKLLLRNLIKKSVLAVKSNKNTSMVRRLFDRLCCEKFNRTFFLPFYSKTRWSSTTFMMRRLIEVGSVISYLSNALLHERSMYGFDASYELPKALTDVLDDAETWKKLEAVHDIFNLICQCIGKLESKITTMFTAKALFLFVRMPIHDYVKISEVISESLVLVYCVNGASSTHLYTHILSAVIHSTTTHAVMSTISTRRDSSTWVSASRTSVTRCWNWYRTTTSMATICCTNVRTWVSIRRLYLINWETGHRAWFEVRFNQTIRQRSEQCKMYFEHQRLLQE